MRGRGIGRVGRRPVVRTMARTAVVVGTASAVAGGISHHQQAKANEAAQDQQLADMQQQEQIDAVAQQLAAQQATMPPPAPQAAPATTDLVSQLKQLADLRDAGILTEDEFNAQKAKILAG